MIIEKSLLTLIQKVSMNKDLVRKKFGQCVSNFELNDLDALEICWKLTSLDILSVIFFVCACVTSKFGTDLWMSVLCYCWNWTRKCFFSLSAHPNAFPNFTHKVTLPLLNCAGTSSQKDLLQILPSLYPDLADDKVHALDKHRVISNVCGCSLCSEVTMW